MNTADRLAIGRADTCAEPYPGFFISFEGGDGTGKSTQAILLAEWLRSAGHQVVLTREPGGTQLGQLLREAVLHGEDIDPRTEALLFATDRADHVAKVIRPALATGNVVITDRYLDSSVAYQAAGRALDAKEVEALSLWATAGLLPDLTVLLDLAPEQAQERLTTAPDRMERAGQDFHWRTRQAFLARAAEEPERWLVLSAAEPIPEIAARIQHAVTALLEQP